MIDFSVCKKCKCFHFIPVIELREAWCARHILKYITDEIPDECEYKLEHIVNQEIHEND